MTPYGMPDEHGCVAYPGGTRRHGDVVSVPARRLSSPEELEELAAGVLAAARALRTQGRSR